jgi:hypothetical protein
VYWKLLSRWWVCGGLGGEVNVVNVRFGRHASRQQPSGLEKIDKTVVVNNIETSC